MALARERTKHCHVHMTWPRRHSAAAELATNGAHGKFHTRTGVRMRN